MERLFRFLLMQDSDIQKVADYVILIHNGKIIFEEKKDDLIYNYGIIRCKKSEFNAARNRQRVESVSLKELQKSIIFR